MLLESVALRWLSEHCVDEALAQTVEAGESGLPPSRCKPAEAGSSTRCARSGPSGATLTRLLLTGVADHW